MTTEPLPGVHTTRLILFRGQRWLTEHDVETCGYSGYVGEIVRVQASAGVVSADRHYELAALVVPNRVGIPAQVSGSGLVWWLIPICAEDDCPNSVSGPDTFCPDHRAANADQVAALLGPAEHSSTDEGR